MVEKDREGKFPLFDLRCDYVADLIFKQLVLRLVKKQ